MTQQMTQPHPTAREWFNSCFILLNFFFTSSPNSPSRKDRGNPSEVTDTFISSLAGQIATHRWRHILCVLLLLFFVTIKTVRASVCPKIELHKAALNRSIALDCPQFVPRPKPWHYLCSSDSDPCTHLIWYARRCRSWICPCVMFTGCHSADISVMEQRFVVTHRYTILRGTNTTVPTLCRTTFKHVIKS